MSSTHTDAYMVPESFGIVGCAIRSIYDWGVRKAATYTEWRAAREERRIARLADQIREDAEELEWWAPAREAERPMRRYVPLAERVAEELRHRAPEPDETPQPADEPAPEIEHEGATAEWSPTDELEQLERGELTPLELLPSHVVAVEQRVPDLDAIHADVHRAFEGWDAAMAPGLARITAVVEAAAAQSPEAYRRWRGEQHTRAFGVVQLDELPEWADQLVAA